MAYDADPSATHDPATGGTPTAAWGDILNANFAAIGAAPTSYTPTWTASSVNPAIGNGTLSGHYVLLGKRLWVHIGITWGTTTTNGTGNYSFGLPSVTSAAYRQCGLTAIGLDAGVTNYIGVASVAASSSVVSFILDRSANPWGAAAPFAWGTADELVIEGELWVA